MKAVLLIQFLGSLFPMHLLSYKQIDALPVTSSFVVHSLFFTGTIPVWSSSKWNQVHNRDGVPLQGWKQHMLGLPGITEKDKKWRDEGTGCTLINRFTNLEMGDFPNILKLLNFITKCKWERLTFPEVPSWLVIGTVRGRSPWLLIFPQRLILPPTPCPISPPPHPSRRRLLYNRNTSRTEMKCSGQGEANLIVLTETIATVIFICWIKVLKCLL